MGNWFWFFFLLAMYIFYMISKCKLFLFIFICGIWIINNNNNNNKQKGKQFQFFVFYTTESIGKGMNWVEPTMYNIHSERREKTRKEKIKKFTLKCGTCLPICFACTICITFCRCIKLHVMYVGSQSCICVWCIHAWKCENIKGKCVKTLQLRSIWWFLELFFFFVRYACLWKFQRQFKMAGDLEW